MQILKCRECWKVSKVERHYYTEEEIKFLQQNVKGRTRKELAELFSERFNVNLTEQQIKGVTNRYKMRSGIDKRFKKGQKAWNDGMKGLNIGGKETQFKKGSIPPNYKEIGTERITFDDYVEVKVSTNKWKAKHHLIWEKENGPIPKGHVVIFGDKNRRNFDINNLLLVSRKQLVRLNQNNLIQEDTELTKAAITVVDIYSKLGELKRIR